MDAIYITSENKDLLVHEIDIEKGTDKFNKDIHMAQFEEEQVWMIEGEC